MQILKPKDLTSDKATCLIYGIPGMGKTTLLGMLPGKTLIVDIDKGTRVLSECENVDIVRISEDLHEIPEILNELRTKCPYQNVAIDSLSELERSLLTFYGRQGSNKGVPGIQDYGRANYKIMDLCRQFISLPCNVFFTAWEEQDEIIASTGEKFSQARPLIRDKIVANICGLCDIVGQVLISQKDGKRYIRLEGSNEAFAKDRIYKRQYCGFEELIPSETDTKESKE